MSDLFLGAPAHHQEEPLPSHRAHQRGKARKAKEQAQTDYEWRETVRKNGWVAGWYSGYAYRTYWRDGRWHYY